MKNEAWSVYCIKDDVEMVLARLKKSGLDLLEVKPLTAVEGVEQVKNPILYIDEPHVIMFHATKLQYERFLFENRRSNVG